LRFKRIRCLAQVSCAFALILCLLSPAFADQKRPTKKQPSPPEPVNPAFSIDLEDEMMKYLGVRYRRGGTSTGGLDCSGYVGLVYRNALGVELPHQSGSIYLSPGFNKVPLEDLMTGDLLFFTPSRKSKRISHVGIYLSEGNFVHAARGKGVVISSLEDDHWSSRILGAKRMEGLESRYPVEGERSGWGFSLKSEQRFLSSVDTANPEILSSFPEVENTADLRWVGNSLGLELGYASALRQSGMDLIHVSLLQDFLLGWKRKGADSPAVWSDESPLSGMEPVVSLVRQVRLGSSLYPSEWLRVTPSVSYFSYPGNWNDAGLPRRSIGLDLALGSIAEGWHVSTGFNYSSLIPDRGLPEEEGFSNAFDMFLTFTQRLSQNTLISLSGGRSQRFGTLEPDTVHLENEDWEDQRFSIMFNFTY
jgi:hypothetical protein